MSDSISADVQLLLGCDCTIEPEPAPPTVGQLAEGQAPRSAGLFTRLHAGCFQFTNDGNVGFIDLEKTCNQLMMATVLSYKLSGHLVATRYFRFQKATGFRRILTPRV